MRLRWTLRARADMVEIGRYIGRHSPAASRRLLDRLRKGAKRVAEMPKSGRVVPELGCTDTRELVVGNYRLVYRVLEASIDVVTVFERHRTIPDLGEGGGTDGT